MSFSRVAGLEDVNFFGVGNLRKATSQDQVMSTFGNERLPDDHGSLAAQSSGSSASAPPRGKRSSFFVTPAPVKRIFSKFPLVTYAPNDLPLRAPSRRHEHNLHVFTTSSDVQKCAPSFNPSCLKWQVRPGEFSAPFTLLIVDRPHQDASQIS